MYIVVGKQQHSVESKKLGVSRCPIYSQEYFTMNSFGPEISFLPQLPADTCLAKSPWDLPVLTIQPGSSFR